MTILIKNGRIITDVEDYIADIFIEKGKISTIYSKISSNADVIIDARGSETGITYMPTCGKW